MDLHDLTRQYSTPRVAAVLGMTERNLVDVRRGRSPLTIDDLFQLHRAYPQFDMTSTVIRIGQLREKNGVSRKQRNNGDPTCQLKSE